MEEYKEIYKGCEIVLRGESGKWSAVTNVIVNNLPGVGIYPFALAGVFSKEEALEKVKDFIDSKIEE